MRAWGYTSILPCVLMSCWKRETTWFGWQLRIMNAVELTSEPTIQKWNALSRVLEKPTVVQLHKNKRKQKNTRLIWNPEVYYLVHRSSQCLRPLGNILFCLRRGFVAPAIHKAGGPFLVSCSQLTVFGGRLIHPKLDDVTFHVLFNRISFLYV